MGGPDARYAQSLKKGKRACSQRGMVGSARDIGRWAIRAQKRSGYGD